VISLLVGVQVVNGLLLPINLFFIWRISLPARDGRAPRAACSTPRRPDRRRALVPVAGARQLTVAG
jgi:hypothetical protein